MRGWFGAPSAGEWRETCAEAERDYRSGRFLIERLGAERYLTPDLTATLWRLRRGLAEETGARSTSKAPPSTSRAEARARRHEPSRRRRR